jgi:hypothetical protein
MARAASPAASSSSPNSAAIHPGAQTFAFDERHRVVRNVTGAAGGQHRHDARMLEIRGESHFARESLGADAAASSAGCTLSTTRRPSARSSATKTRDMPPPPSSRSIV